MNYGGGWGGWGGSGFLSFAPFFFLMMIWSIFWKGLALWHSSKKDQGWWFLILLIVNTAGILEIIYLFAVLKLKTGELFPKKGPSVSGDQQ